MITKQTVTHRQACALYNMMTQNNKKMEIMRQLIDFPMFAPEGSLQSYSELQKDCADWLRRLADAIEQPT